jgi:3,4-dihydroxy 2-butanone 4-phosphate synthase/GTP cyclohydrolase II
MLTTDSRIQGIEDLARGLAHQEAFSRRAGRPFVALSYAQSIDGSIAARNRRPVRISGPASMVLTHRLRSLCDAILVGIGTVLADDPRLSVRLVEGAHPRPVVLDTRLRTPLEARLLQKPPVPPWLAGSAANPAERVRAATRAGAEVLACELDDRGRIHLPRLLGLLHARGVRSLMVEGGARVIASFLTARLVDLFVITLAPMLLGGLPVVDGHPGAGEWAVSLRDAHYEHLEGDLVLWARPGWRQP